MQKGYTGRILDVNLSTGQAISLDLDVKTVPGFLGGLGLGIKILYDEVGPDVEPLSPDNIIIVATGPLSGTSAPTNGRTQIVTKSPLTGLLGTGNFGGWWGPRLKFAGFEGMVIRGRAEKPVYVWIEDESVEIRSAQHLWGMDSWETTDALKAELGSDASVLAIGQAGENLVRFACPVVDYYHAPGRSDAGCIMGAKKLKAIAVRGTGRVAIRHPNEFNKAVKQVVDRIFQYPERGSRLKVGSHAFLIPAARSGAVMVGNFQTTVLPPDSDLWKLPGSYTRHVTREDGQYGYQCPMAPLYGCDLVADVKKGRYAGLKIGGVSFGYPAWQWGGKCQIKSYPAMFKCRELCQRYGMDQTTPLPFAMELYEKGIITKQDLNGMELKFGDEAAIINMLGKIAHRQDFGDVLAEGSVRAAQKIGKGAEKYVMAIKGKDMMEQDPRGGGIGGMATNLGYMVCERGGDDLCTTHASLETFPGWAKEAGWSEDKYFKWFVDYIPMFDDVKGAIFGTPPQVKSIRPDTLAGKAAWVKWFGDLVCIYNSLGLCMFSGSTWTALGPVHYADLYSACTGWQMTPEEMLKSGERIHNLMRAYIVREGITRKDDDWPERFYEEPLPDGPNRGALASREKMSQMLDDYYHLMGWDRDGKPTKEKLIELGLNNVADDLCKRGVI